jgi:Flp pilus assembly CpaE family ATPase
MTDVPVVTAADGARWESRLVSELEEAACGFTVVRRCVDVLDLIAVAATGQAAVAVLDARLRRLDEEALGRIRSSGVAVVLVVSELNGESDQSLFGADHVIPATAAGPVFASVMATALADVKRVDTPERGFSAPWPDASALVTDLSSDLGSPPIPPAPGGAVIAVWGPSGAPGRTTVAVNVAAELAGLARETMLIDGDPYGGVIATVLGVTDESPGLAAACRHAQSRRLDPEGLSGLAWQVQPRLRLLSGLARADRWPELRPSGVEGVLDAARRIAAFTVVDVGFCLEADEEISFDTMAPRRNGATLEVLDRADLVLAVGAADPVGIQRLSRGMAELTELRLNAPVWVVLNRVRRAAVPGRVSFELDAALERYVGQPAACRLPLDQDAVDRAIVCGQMLAECAPGSPLRLAFAELATALSGTQAPATRTSRHRRREARGTGGDHRGQ